MNCDDELYIYLSSFVRTSFLGENSSSGGLSLTHQSCDRGNLNIIWGIGL